VITLFLEFIINVRRNVYIDRLVLIDFGSISNADDPDEFGFDVP